MGAKPELPAKLPKVYFHALQGKGCLSWRQVGCASVELPEWAHFSILGMDGPLPAEVYGELIELGLTDSVSRHIPICMKERA